MKAKNVGQVHLALALWAGESTVPGHRGAEQWDAAGFALGATRQGPRSDSARILLVEEPAESLDQPAVVHRPAKEVIDGPSHRARQRALALQGDVPDR